MKQVFLTMFFALLFLGLKSQTPGIGGYAKVYPYSLPCNTVTPFNNRADFRNGYILELCGSDSVWYFVDYTGRGIYFSTGGSVAPGLINTSGVITGDGSALNPIKIIPGTTSGNILQWNGSAWVQVPGTSISDKDFLQISNNLPPSAVTGQNQYTKNKTTFGGRVNISGQDVMNIDSTDDADFINRGFRNAKMTNWDWLNNVWSQLAQIGNEAVLQAGTGTNIIRVKTGAGTNPLIPTAGKTVLYYNVADTSWYFTTYPDGRNDAVTPFNFLATQSNGRLVSLPFSTLPGGTVTGGNNGVSLSGANIQLGNNVGSASAQLTGSREIPMNGQKVIFSGNSGNVIIGDTAARAQVGASAFTALWIKRFGARVLNTPIFGIWDSLTSSQTNTTLTEWNIRTPGNEFAPYTSFIGYVPNAGEPGINNLVYIEGWNASPTGRIRTDQPAMYMHMENNYPVTGHGNVMEYILSATGKNGANTRFWYYIVNRDSIYNSSSFFEAKNHQWRGLGANTAMSLSAPRTSADNTALSLLPSNGGGDVALNMYGASAFSNRLRMTRPTGATGAGNLDNILTYSVRNSKGMAVLGSNPNRVGIGSDMLYMNPDGGPSSIVRNNAFFTLHVGSISSLFTDQITTVLAVHGSTGFQDISPGSGSGNDILRLQNTSVGGEWGFSVDGTGYGISKTATAGRFSSMLKDSATTRDYNYAVFGKVGMRIPAGQTANRSSAPVRGDFRMNLQTRGFEGVRVGTTYEKFLQLNDTLSATAGQFLGWNGSIWGPTTATNIYNSDGVLGLARTATITNYFRLNKVTDAGTGIQPVSIRVGGTAPGLQSWVATTSMDSLQIKFDNAKGFIVQSNSNIIIQNTDSNNGITIDEASKSVITSGGVVRNAANRLNATSNVTIAPENSVVVAQPGATNLPLTQIGTTAGLERQGTSHWVTNYSGGTLTLTPFAGELINNAASATIPDGKSAWLMCIGPGDWALMVGQ